MWVNKIIIIGTITFDNTVNILNVDRWSIICSQEELNTSIELAEKDSLDYVIPIDSELPCYLHGVCSYHLYEHLFKVGKDKNWV